MSVTAKQLSKAGARGKDLDAVVREQLQIIDDKLLRADRTWGRNVVSHDLPTMLALPGLDKKDAQRIVYSSILRSLSGRGFETCILLEPDRTTVYIAWMTDLDTVEVEAMNALLRSQRVTRPEADAFRKRGTAAPNAASAARQGRAEPAPSMTVSAADRVMKPRGGLSAPAVATAAAKTRPALAKTSPAETELLRGA